MTILVEAQARHNEPVDKLLKRFTRKCKREDILNEVSSRSEFKSKKEKRHEKRAKSRRAAQKKAHKR